MRSNKVDEVLFKSRATLWVLFSPAEERKGWKLLKLGRKLHYEIKTSQLNLFNSNHGDVFIIKTKFSSFSLTGRTGLPYETVACGPDDSVLLSGCCSRRSRRSNIKNFYFTFHYITLVTHGHFIVFYFCSVLTVN